MAYLHLSFRVLSVLTTDRLYSWNPDSTGITNAIALSMNLLIPDAEYTVREFS
jgi:hypothetical protein